MYSLTPSSLGRPRRPQGGKPHSRRHPQQKGARRTPQEVAARLHALGAEGVRADHQEARRGIRGYVGMHGGHGGCIGVYRHSAACQLVRKDCVLCVCFAGPFWWDTR